MFSNYYKAVGEASASLRFVYDHGLTLAVSNPVAQCCSTLSEPKLPDGTVRSAHWPRNNLGSPGTLGTQLTVSSICHGRGKVVLGTFDHQGSPLELDRRLSDQVVDLHQPRYHRIGAICISQHKRPIQLRGQ